MFEPEVFRKQMYCIKESTYDIVVTFRRPPRSFGASAVIRRPGIYAHLVPLVTPLDPMIILSDSRDQIRVPKTP